MSETHRCPFLPRHDPRCLPARLTALLVEDLIYYCGQHPERCPLYEALALETATEEPPEKRRDAA